MVSIRYIPRARLRRTGGGYVKPITTQLNLLWKIKKSLPPTSSICLLSYSLASGSQYPIQLRQAVSILSYLVMDQGKKPGKVLQSSPLLCFLRSSHSQLVLCGDSAGASLVLSVLSHLLHPHPCVPELKLSEPLCGAAVVSPWGDFRTSAASYARNADNDSIDGPILRKWSAFFMNSAQADNYNQPFRASDDWWRNLDSVLQDLLITAGTDEVLVDDIEAFAKRIEVGITEIGAQQSITDRYF